MTAGLGRGLALAGIGVAVGLAVVAALFGTGDLLKRVRGAEEPAEVTRPAAALPQTDRKAPGTAAKSAPAKGDRPRAETGDLAAIDPSKAPLASPDATPQGETQPAAGTTPSLDILRVEPTGEAVLAGRGAPKASVELRRDNQTIARTTADESGQFAMDGLALPPGNSELTLRSTTPDGKTTVGKASAVVVIDKDRKAQPLVAVSEPDKATRVLSMPSPVAEAVEDATKDAKNKDSGKAAATGDKAAPTQREAALPASGGKAAAPAAEAPPVKIVSVDAQEGGRLFVSGQGAAWTSLRLYLNDTLVASGRSGADGRIAFTIGRGVKPGGYQIRIDQVDDTSGKVGQRAQVGFNFPPQLGSKEPAKEPIRTAVREAPARTEAQSGRLSETSTAAPPAPAKASTSETPAMAAGAARSNPVTPAPETDKRTAEALAPKLPGGERLSGSEARAAAPPASAPGGVESLPANPPAAPPRLAERPAAKAQSPDAMAAVVPNPTPGDQPATVFVPEIETAKITRGDNLWQISRRSYGDGRRYTVIYDANRDQIRDPNLIYPGQIFVMPKDAVPAAGGQGARRG